MIKTYENLALEGGGVWGIAYAGAIEQLDQLGVLTNIKRVAGTSAGSITALMLALGYSGSEIYHMITGLDYARLQENRDFRQLLNKYGIYDGAYATQLFQGWICEKLGSEEASFADLAKAGGMDLRVYATNLNKQQVHEFSYRRTPHIPLAAAVRASMSVPLFFTATQIGNELFVDGGAVFDYPLLGFGEDEILNTLGLAFAGSSSVAYGDSEGGEFGFGQFPQYIHRLTIVLQRVQAPLLALYEPLRANTILINTGDISSLHFRLNQEEKTFLVESGRNAVRKHFSNMF